MANIEPNTTKELLEIECLYERERGRERERAREKVCERNKKTFENWSGQKVVTKI